MSDEFITIDPPREPQVCRDCGKPIQCEACYNAACEAEAKGLREMMDRVES